MKKKLLLTLLLGAVLTFTGCGSDANQDAGTNVATESTAEDTTKELKTVKIGATAATAALSENALLAQNLGYIDEELAAVGYKPEYIGFAGAGPAVNEAFAAGEIDYAFYADFPAITAKSNGVDLKVIGVGNQEMNYALLVTEASGIQSAADIEGKKIIVTPGTILYKYFVELCEENSIDFNSVEIVNALTDAQTVLASGDADGLIISLGGAKMYEAMGLGKVIVDSTSNLDQSSGFTLTGRTEFVDANPDVNKALLRALKRSAEYAQENPAEAYKLMVTEATPEAVLVATYGYDPSFSYFSPELSDKYLERAQKVYEFAKSNSLLGGDVNLDELFDSTYVDEVLAE